MKVRIEIKGVIEVDLDNYDPVDFGFDEGTPAKEVLSEMLQEEYENGDLDPEFIEVASFEFHAEPIDD